MSDLANRLESGLAPAWRPDKDDPDTLIGKVVNITIASSNFSDEPYPILVIRKDDGEAKAVHAFHFVLKGEIMKQHPQIGEHIGIKFLGEVTPKNGGNSYNGYRVEVDRQPGAFDWSAFGKSGEVTPVVQDPYTGAADTPAQSVDIPDSIGDDDIPF